MVLATVCFNPVILEMISVMALASRYFNNWVYDTTMGKPVSCSIMVTGVNGDTVGIVANGSSYIVTYTIGGVPTSYTVNY